MIEPGAWARARVGSSNCRVGREVRASRLCPVRVSSTVDIGQVLPVGRQAADLRFRRFSLIANDDRSRPRRPVTAEAAGSSPVGVARVARVSSEPGTTVVT